MASTRDLAASADDIRIHYKIDHNVRNCILAETTNFNLEDQDVFFGFLIGDDAEAISRIISCIKCTNYENSEITKKPNWTKETREIFSLIPTGLKICGLCYINKNKKNVEQSSIKEMFPAAETQDEMIINEMLLWLIDVDSVGRHEAFVYNVQEEKISESEIEFGDIYDDFFTEKATFRLKYKSRICAKELKCCDICESLSKEVTTISNQLSSATFYLAECELLLGNEVIYDRSKRCEDLLENIRGKEQGFSQGKMNKNRKSNSSKKDVLNVQHMTSCNKSNQSNNHDHVPAMFCKKQEFSYINMVVVLDVLVMVPSNTTIAQLPSLFIRGIKDQLQAIVDCIETHTKGSSLCLPKVYHFKTHQSSYLTTCIYPWKEITGELVDHRQYESERSALLKKLLLPSQRPTLHPNNNYLFQDDHCQVTYIINPHEKLTNPGGDGCHVAVVDGLYSYHHYMQDNFDDNKWGCAYRSLQTICSWFRYQGYSEKPIPDHRSIQEALVAIGDKQSSFVSSKKWIGSFEVSLCLEYFLGVTSKIMAVNSGEVLQYKGRELLQHFETQGTPVMIGGGVLAHTILGVSFNDKTGEIKFLILDPHYTGGEDLKVILDKGWCGWKNQQFWNQRAHYNLCMPQRPNKI